MAKYPFTKKELRAAVRIFAEKQESVLEAVLDNDPVTFSDTFQHKMNTLLRQTSLAAAKRHKTRSRIAAAGLALILFLTAFFSFNTTARAEFTSWVKTIYSDVTSYLFSGKNREDRLPVYVPQWLPEGVYKDTEEENENSYSRLYLNNETEKGFFFYCQRASEGAGIFIVDDESRLHVTAQLGGWDVDCYISDGGDSDYVWHDSDGRFFFSINSNLPHEVNEKIIENLKLESK